MTKNEFGERIYRLRKQMGLSQLEFSLQCNMQSGYIARLELGERNPTLDTMTKIADGAGISLSELLAEEEPTVEEQDANLNKIMIYARRMRPEAREDLATIVKLILKHQ